MFFFVQERPCTKFVQKRPCTKFVQERPCTKFVGLIGQGESFGRPAFFLGKRHQNTRRGRVTALADLEPSIWLGFGLGLGSGLGLGWSGPTC